MSPHVLVWDLDGTVGEFDAIERAGGAEIRVTTRPGLAAALAALSQAGFVHSLLTRAAYAYAEAALRGTGLRDYFARVEGPDRRRKGDAAGVAVAFGIPAAEMPARLLFVGDRLMFDEPDHPDVVFHLEPFVTRPAAELERLALHLRDAGGGSIREGFRATGRAPRRWFPWGRPRPLPVGQTSPRRVPGVGELLLLERPGECPVIGYQHPPSPPAAADEHRFVPEKPGE